MSNELLSDTALEMAFAQIREAMSEFVMLAHIHGMQSQHIGAGDKAIKAIQGHIKELKELPGDLIRKLDREKLAAVIHQANYSGCQCEQCPTSALRDADAIREYLELK